MEFYAVIPTLGNRPTELAGLISDLVFQGLTRSQILVINSGDTTPPAWRSAYVTEVPPINRPTEIYGHWNQGLEWAYWDKHYPGPRKRGHAVAILNDDVRLPGNFVRRMKDALFISDATIAFPNQHGHMSSLYNREPGPTSLDRRISGYAFVVAGHHGIRLDEDFHWWYGDDDLDWRARSDYNGTFQVYDVTVEHLYPSESTNTSPELQAIASRDREHFTLKHGRAPW